MSKRSKSAPIVVHKGGGRRGAARVSWGFYIVSETDDGRGYDCTYPPEVDEDVMTTACSPDETNARAIVRPGQHYNGEAVCDNHAREMGLPDAE